MSAPGIYVEIPIQSSLDELWQKTQDPALHQRWDLRFTTIFYLPRGEDEPQRFLYETRIGLGLTIAGGGESTGEHNSASERTSALHFWSQDRMSLILDGSGYWKYIEAADTVRFFTWYDYTTRFGLLGRAFDRICFRPLIGWATAWSFDRLRLWIERGISPEEVLRWSMVYGISRVAIVAIWLWHGIVPKLLFPQADELHMLTAHGLPAQLLPIVGALEVAFGLVGLLAWRWRGYFLITSAVMLLALASVVITTPEFLTHAFNPVTLNLAVIALSCIGYLAYGSTAFAARCLRRSPDGRR
jgi:DoxX-like family